jgi:hypothetical protein
MLLARCSDSVPLHSRFGRLTGASLFECGQSALLTPLAALPLYTPIFAFVDTA